MIPFAHVRQPVGAGLRHIRQEIDMRSILIAGLISAGAAFAVASSAPARAEEEHRELGPHVHGHGTLNIAVEDKRVSMELEVPGMDIVGFEHDATTDAQKSAMEKAKAELAKPLDVFKLPAAAGCTVADTNIALEAEHHHEGEEADHDDHGDHADEDHDHDEHAGHKAFHVTYALDCTEPSNLTSITFDYFKMFAGAHDLTVNVVTAKAQSKYEVSRDKPDLDLAGTM
jgi:Protein of unknown function (DUF2796)